MKYGKKGTHYRKGHSVENVKVQKRIKYKKGQCAEKDTVEKMTNKIQA